MVFVCQHDAWICFTGHAVVLGSKPGPQLAVWCRPLLRGYRGLPLFLGNPSGSAPEIRTSLIHHHHHHRYGGRRRLYVCALDFYDWILHGVCQGTTRITKMFYCFLLFAKIIRYFQLVFAEPNPHETFLLFVECIQHMVY